jgi:hypothetical protein
MSTPHANLMTDIRAGSGAPHGMDDTLRTRVQRSIRDAKQFTSGSLAGACCDARRYNVHVNCTRRTRMEVVVMIRDDVS